MNQKLYEKIDDLLGGRLSEKSKQDMAEQIAKDRRVQEAEDKSLRA
jgi:hypothetical protein